MDHPAAAVAAPLTGVAAVVSWLVGSAALAFAGALGVNAAVGAVFAAHDYRLVGSGGGSRLAPSVMTALFGAWFIYGPLTYDPGAAATAVVQTGGTVVAAGGVAESAGTDNTRSAED